MRLTLPAALAGLVAAAPAAGAQALPAPSLAIDTVFAPPTGIARTDFPPPNTAGTFRDVPGGVAVYGDRIYTVGVAGSGDGQDVAIAARRPDGTLDPGFSGDGKLTVSVGAEADIGTGIAVLAPDGRLRVAVATDRSATSDANLDVAVVGLNADGGPDETFGAEAGGVRRVILAEGPDNEVPARIEAGAAGRVAIVGSRTEGTRDDFVALLEADGSPVTGPANGFGQTGVRFSGTASPVDRGVDVAFRPGGGLVTLISIDPPSTVLRAFNADGTPDATFGAGGELAVGGPGTVPGGLVAHAGGLWVAGSASSGTDTDALLARAGADGAGLQIRPFDMRGRFLPATQAVLSRAHDLVAVPGDPETLVAVGSVTYGFEGQTFTDWAAGAFNGLDGPLEGAGFGDIVLQAPGSGELLAAAAGAGWVGVAGTYIDSSDSSFGNARLLVDADKACDLEVSVAEPGELVFQASRPAALTARVQNVGTRPCAGTLTVPAPYRMTPIGTGVVAPGATFVTPATAVTYHGPRRAEDVLAVALDAPDANATNNRASAHVVFSYCDLALSPVGPAGLIPTEGRRRFEVTLRNRGTATCLVRVGSRPAYRLVRGRSASDAVAVAAPPRARPGTRVRVVLRARAGEDVEPANNAVTVSPAVVRVGDSDVRVWSRRRFAGTARGGAGDLAARRLAPARVHLAVLRVGRKCAWLRSARGSFTSERPRGRGGDCGRPRWLRADGTTDWQLALGRSLAPGRYVVFSRTTIRAGFPEARFTAKDRNRIAFVVG